MIRKKIDFLILIEHTAREFDIACLLKLHLDKKGYKVAVTNYYHDIQYVTKKFKPRVVVYPFLYYVDSDKEAMRYISTWVSAIHFNIAWEQIFYQGILNIKAPADDFVKQIAIHHAWGKFYQDYLLSFGVKEKNIFLNGNPAFQLYLEPYKNFYSSRAELAEAFALDPQKKWIFFPENYRWAFIDDAGIKWREEMGGDYDEMLKMRSVCTESLKLVLCWIHKIAQNNDYIFIIRPKPATPMTIMQNFYRFNISKIIPNNVFIDKSGSVREWILASDVTVSSFSTTLIEAAIAKKPIGFFIPITLPKSLDNTWYEKVRRISSFDEFHEFCLNSSNADSRKLEKWAIENMLAKGDPILGLVGYLEDLYKKSCSSVVKLDLKKLYSLIGKKYSPWLIMYINKALAKIITLRSISIKYLNNYLTKKDSRWNNSNNDKNKEDFFSCEDVVNNIAKWKKVLNID